MLITGAARGIGKTLLEHFLVQGSEVIAVVRKKTPRLEELSSQYPLVCVESDIRDTAKIKAFLNAYVANGNKIDILINNAAVLIEKKLTAITEADWDEMVDINGKGTFFLSLLLAEHMKQNGGGNIINAASFAVAIPSYKSGIYAATKSMVLSLTKSLAAELAPDNIRVNCFSPGVVETEMTAPKIAKNKEAVINALALHKLGETDDVANAVLFLASDASAYITGEELKIDGGKFIIQNPAAPWLDK